VGVPAFKYNMSLLGVVRTESTEGRGGTRLGFRFRWRGRGTLRPCILPMWTSQRSCRGSNKIGPAPEPWLDTRGPVVFPCGWLPGSWNGSTQRRLRELQTKES
jgi:hypothetical protein